MAKVKRISRSAESGEFVSAAKAKANPKETVTETVPVARTEAEQIADCAAETQRLIDLREAAEARKHAQG